MTTSQTDQTTSESAPKYYSNTDSNPDLFKKPTISDLNALYTDGDSADQDVFAEMRSNILLASGEHYTKRTSRYFRRVRDSKELSDNQKIRLTKNHVQRICKIYANNIVSMNPGVGFTPKDENSMHDQKVAELHHSVWKDAYQKYHIDDKIDDWVDSFIEIGELHVKLFYDPNQGAIKGYEPLAPQDPEQDPDAFEESSFEEENFVPEETEPELDYDRPIREGAFVFEEVYGMNLLRPPECKDLRDAEWLGIRKMTSRDELLRQFKMDEAQQAKITSDQDETYVVFDALKGGYKKTTKQTMIREYYYRPSSLFPKGYFYITTKQGILAEGELPGGLFPIVTSIFDKIKTTPRGRGPIRVMRPYQAEINRSASKIAEHQITLGDDKLIVQNGQKVSAGASLPGVRTISVAGTAPTVMPGRDGSQYFAYSLSQITELYEVMNVKEDSEAADTGQLDVYTLLFRSARQKKKFQRYIKRFEKFLIELVTLYLKLAKIHLPDDAVIWAVGKNEQVNIDEFRQLADTCYEVNIEAQADDIDTKLGKQIVLNHAIQYVGPQLKPEEVGKLLRQMPYANFDESFNDMTMNYDRTQNEMLALDRGETPPVGQYDDHPYFIKRLSFRMSKADYQFLSPQIKQNYEAKIKVHQEMEAANQAAIARAKSGFIPTGGYLVGCEFYVKDPMDATGNKTKRVRVPYQSLEWLLKQLEAQGQGMEALEAMNSSQQASVADAFNRQQGMEPPMNGPVNTMPM